MRLRKPLLLAAASASACALPAAAQVSVPLPGRPTTNPAPPLAPPPQSQSVPVALPGAPAIPLNAEGRPDINPYNRDIDLTVPLTYRDRTLGEVPIHLTADDRYALASEPFLKLLAPLLNPKSRAKLESVLGTSTTFGEAELANTGVSLTYDPSALAVVVVQIGAGDRALEFLFPSPSREEDMPDLAPAGFSAFVNLNVIGAKTWGSQDRLLNPSFYLDGAARLGGIVLEADGQVSEDFGGEGGSYRLDRNYVRLVYDQPEKYRRFYAGDLQPEIRGQQTFVRMGGIGVSRQRRRFDQYRSAILQGNRQIILQRASTIDVFRNGSLLRQFRLDPGSYDLSTLPLISGSNDVSIQVRDDAGSVQNIAYNSYLDPIDLQPGDFEYAGYVGKTSTRYGRSPIYDGELAFSGFFRKAFVDKPAIGVGVQASKRVQNVVGQTQFILRDSSRVQFDLGASNARNFGTGFSTGVSYDLLLDRGDKVDAVTLRADYVSRRYAGLGNDQPDNPTAWSLGANYSRTLSQDVTLLLGGSYIKGRRDATDSYRIDANTSYRFHREWSVRGGLNYTHYSGSSFSRQNGLGFNLSLVFQPNYRDRMEARYESNNENATLSYVHSPTGLIDSVGYGAIAGRDFGSANAQAFADYIGNRFDLSASHSAYGRGFGSIGDQQITTLRLGTSLALADGHFGVGRRVTDSFAVLYPHETLKGHSIVAGQSLARNDYMSKSGTFGGAVNGYLNSYTSQSIQYDVEDAPRGYDIGPGVVRVKPPYKSGYALQVGTDAFVSATGTLNHADGKPVSLAGGSVTVVGAKEPVTTPFFTNSIGRFAIQNLRPGLSYHVELFGSNQTFEFSVPKKTDGLVDLKIVKLTP